MHISVVTEKLHSDMSVYLIMTDQCSTCKAAADTWQHVCDQLGLKLHMLIIGRDPEAQEIVNRLDIVVFPALVVDETVKAVGVLDEEKAKRLLA
jgi:glutaredoxin